MTELIGGRRWPHVRAIHPATHTTSSRSWSGPLAALFVVAVMALAIVGTWQAIVMLASPSLHGDHSGHAGLGERTPSAFGFMTVETVNVINGLTAQDVGGMTHGISGLVPAEQAQVEVAVRLENTSPDGIPVDPAQFQLTVAGSPPVAPTGATVKPMSLPAGAAVDVSLTFDVPRSGGQMNFQYTDPLTGSQVDIPVGRVDQAPASEGGTHDAH